MNQLLKACIYTWRGLLAALRGERAFQQEAAVFAIAVPVSFVIAAEPWKRFLLIAVLLLVMIVELLNTAVEKLSDHVAPRRHNRIRDVKDMGSAAVGLSIVLRRLRGCSRRASGFSAKPHFITVNSARLQHAFRGATS